MSVLSTVTAEHRSLLGTNNSRRLRAKGRVPGNIYGLKQPNIAVTFSSEELSPVVASGTHVIDVVIAGETSKAVVREAQWDTFFTKLLHLDLQRIDPSVRINVEVAIEAKGTPASGVMDQPLRDIVLNCLAYQVPEKIFVRVGTLKVGDQVTVSQLELPEGAACALDANTVVIRVHEVKNVVVALSEFGAAEPEIIGRKKADEENAE